ncbi:MAG TPA: hypothetical protein VJH95_02785 [Candidatus Nanoarchaeia archaeon]|nr:hypothetical protein [Candidatus Nanoarchaeia archaeon]
MKEKISKEIKELVLWKIEVDMPQNFRLSMGDKGTFNKEDLKKHVEAEDEVGRAYINVELKFIKSLMNGEFSRILAG